MVIRTAAACIAALAITSAPALAQAPAPRKPAPEAEVCKNCHADYVESYFKTKHGQGGNQKVRTARPATATPTRTSPRAAARA